VVAVAVTSFAAWCLPRAPWQTHPPTATGGRCNQRRSGRGTTTAWWNVSCNFFAVQLGSCPLATEPIFYFPGVPHVARRPSVAVPCGRVEPNAICGDEERDSTGPMGTRHGDTGGDEDAVRAFALPRRTPERRSGRGRRSSGPGQAWQRRHITVLYPRAVRVPRPLVRVDCLGS